MTKEEYFNRFLPPRLQAKDSGQAYAPANIALSKYWGKRDAALNLPTNGSLSISLGALGTHTTVIAIDAPQDMMVLNGKNISPDSAFYRKAQAFIRLFRRGQTPSLLIESSNTIPTAAGLASSASGFAALTLALADLWQLDLDSRILSSFARIGSGSAARSLWHGFVKWQKGEAADGSDSYAMPITSDWQDLHIGLLEIDTAEKSVSSRDGMNHTVATSPLYAPWTACAEADLQIIEEAIANRDFHLLAQTAESNALAMHASMMAARPALIYLQAESFRQIARIHALRAQGLPLYFTADAGPNLKLLYLAKDETEVLAAFPHMVAINPFA